MFIVCVLFVLLPLTSTKQYRTDYVYNERADAFYNLHIESRDRWRAERVCKAEGATLMVPESNQDITQFHAMFKRFPDLGDYAWVKDDGLQHEPAAQNVYVLGESAGPEDLFARRCDVLTREGQVETYRCVRQLPFICKVNARDAYHDAVCNVDGKNYQYIQALGSCYKISEIAYTWNEAYAECQKEGAHLVVLNSEAESQVVWDLIKRAPHLSDAKAHFFFFAGYRAKQATGNKPREFRTIFNQTLQESGFDQWSEGEPNNALDNEFCGSIFKNDGKLNDLNCFDAFAFICEKEKI